MTTHRTRTVAAGFVATLALAACSATGSGGGGDEDTDVLRVVTHDSFTLSEGLLAGFEDRTGYTVEHITPGDGGALVNQLVLTRDNPLGDVVYGIDNSFAARAVEEGVLQPYRSPDATQTVMEDSLTAVDFGDVCINVDHEWFREQGLAEPQTLEDLTDPAYADLLVVTNPATSSPGLAFLLATVGAFGEDGWEQYWRDLTANGVQVVEGWSDAYYVDFSGSEGAGPRPLVLSYSSSPAAEVPDGGSAPRTGALLDTCFRQTEYAGVLAGAENVEGAQEFVDFLLSPEVQADIPGSMYMYPVLDGVALPQEWADHAPVSPAPHEVEPQAITDNRDQWIETWTEIVVG
ncbi:thiamine transport system substrate-binding protein [Georgenia satyanarayanai]|uniref:Thiamine transport system substrate-binding protein n=1 Tax=Georgenia satyanarayanai TaxID=860221 RepID=A0A2Y9AHW5_9MICO|nr:thiamine ABC transporter substrate-binding protein [Georgenia satyanarayanai]PYF99082.1 thiamine transport system substrate-binding protein [Georgenia satyanarayanai]SSA44044.1 thiamine transport system substrate-binding protein [Georgenia satyanarayanai]